MNIHLIYRFFQRRFRKPRMLWFQEYFKISDTTTILDVGGTQYNWQFLTCKATVTILNLSKPTEWDDKLENFRFEEGDGICLKYADKAFDVVYSNSVIEHLSTWANQVRFAEEVKRVGRNVYVQTPAEEFFVEPHLITPFIHWLPLGAQSRLMRNFTVWGIITRPTQSYVDAFLSERRLLTLEEFSRLFNNCKIVHEKFLLWTKSYVAVTKK